MIGPGNTSPEIGGAARDTAILGIGSLEQHSLHLPVETDFFFASRISREVAERLDAVLRAYRLTRQFWQEVRAGAYADVTASWYQGRSLGS